jgi:hypothetical protein
VKHNYTEEEQAERLRIGKEHRLQSILRQNQLDKDMSTKIWLQSEALDAMPENLRTAALIIDETPPPPGRPWPKWWTPPVKGFTYKHNTDEEDETANAAQIDVDDMEEKDGKDGNDSDDDVIRIQFN